MRRDLVRRLARLEESCAQTQVSPVPLVLLLGAECERPLGPGEYIVMDWFRDSGSILFARERTTADCADAGRRCQPGGHLGDVVEELHADCEWRRTIGSCPICRGTPVAEEGCR
jgi:hypothetical protein